MMENKLLYFERILIYEQSVAKQAYYFRYQIKKRTDSPKDVNFLL